jgi:DNA-binding HxlR family transcriptional regulator
MLIAFTIYLAAHLTFYILWLRHLTTLRTEKGIFLYHLASAVITAVVAVISAFISPTEFGIPGCVLILSMHGIYSLSFLELWSLAQGGYSLSIIAGMARAEASGEDLDFSALEAIGEAKQADRVTALERMGLVSRSGEHISLTSRGNSIAEVLHLLRRWVDPGEQQLGD